MDYKIITRDRYRLHLIQTQKYKTLTISLKFKSRIDATTTSLRALLPHVLKAKTQLYDSKKALSKRLETLYGAELSTGVSKIGQASVMSFQAKMVDPRRLGHDLSMFYDLISVLTSMVYHPYVNNDAFDSHVLKEEKRLIIEDLEALKDNKTRFALKRMIDVMCENETYAISVLGDIDSVKSIDGAKLYQYYLSVLNTDALDIIVSGDFNEEEILSLLDDTFTYFHANSHFSIIDFEEKEVLTVKEVTEYDTLAQTKLNVGFRVNTRMFEPDYYAFLVFNNAFGGYPHSRLFTEVREKHSLCYYISSRYDGLKGIMYVYAGVEHGKQDPTREIILSLLEDMQQGNINDELVTMTKKAMINDLLESYDSQRTTAERAYVDGLLQRNFDINQAIQSIQAVSEDDIRRVANKVVLDTIYVLTQKGSDKRD